MRKTALITVILFILPLTNMLSQELDSMFSKTYLVNDVRTFAYLRGWSGADPNYQNPPYMNTSDFTTDEFKATTFVYYVKTNLSSGEPIYDWYPCHYNQIKLVYTI